MKITLGPEKPYLEEEPTPVCERCKKPIENYFLHLSLEKECKESKEFRRWCLILFKAIKEFKDRIKNNPSEINTYEKSIINFLNNAGLGFFSFLQIINNLLETINRYREIGYHESILEETEEFLSLILSFTSLVYTETGEEKSHETEAFLNEIGKIYRLIMKGHGKESDFYVPTTPLEGLSDILYCQECNRVLSFNFDPQKTKEKFIKFYEIKNELLSTNIPDIDLNSGGSLRNYLDSIESSLFLDFIINILIARKLIGKLDQPIISLGNEEKGFLKNLNTIIKFLNENQWFRALVYYFQNKALLADFSKLILNNIEDFIKLISNPNNIQIFEFDVIKSFELKEYESFKNLILFLRFAFSAINENNPEKLLKSLENIKSIRNIYICPFCSRIYLLLTNGKYIVFGEDYLEIGDFDGNEIKQCFKTSPNHYVVKIYPDELS
jgi:hypothetical protein